jgi:hypothetical protein
MLTLDYFCGELLIPNLTGNSEANGAIAEIVNRSIALYEPRFLRSVLGTLYDGFAADMTSVKSKAIIAHLYDEVNLISPVANFVYVNFRRDTMTDAVPTGEGVGSYENLTISQGYKQQFAWNLMCDLVDDFWTWLESYDTSFSRYGCYTTGMNPFRRVTNYSSC